MPLADVHLDIPKPRPVTGSRVMPLFKFLPDTFEAKSFFAFVLLGKCRLTASPTIADAGAYELRDEAFDEVDPFFYHYTRNHRREEAF
ncbi:hypothetical protein B0H13DRAFT_2656270 [Mycena leptocephala]|nr:hypothetical protein B0H13DRAFT_2656270 [Mycena leptocephala]